MGRKTFPCPFAFIALIAFKYLICLLYRNKWQES